MSGDTKRPAGRHACKECFGWLSQLVEKEGAKLLHIARDDVSELPEAPSCRAAAAGPRLPGPGCRAPAAGPRLPGRGKRVLR